MCRIVPLVLDTPQMVPEEIDAGEFCTFRVRFHFQFCHKVSDNRISLVLLIKTFILLKSVSVVYIKNPNVNNLVNSSDDCFDKIVCFR